MSNPYTGASITGCNSPTIGNDRSTYSGVFDTAMQAVDNHDHTSGKGKQIPTAGIVDASVTSAKLATGAALANIANGSIVTALLADGSVATAKLADTGVTTAKLADGAVTMAKSAVSNRVISTASGTQTPGVGNVDVPNMTCPITTTGGDVEVLIIPDPADTCQIFVGPHKILSLILVRDTTTIATMKLQNPDETINLIVPPTIVRALDLAPTAGAHTYKLQFGGDGTSTIQGAKLLVRETK